MTTLETERLVLRLPELGDAREIAAALNDFDISKNLSLVPYPYTEKDAEAYVARAAVDAARGETYRHVIRRKSDGALVGCCGLHQKDGGWNIGYWIAKAQWRQGYAGEAARRVVEFAFDDLGVDPLMAGWYHDNAISGRILAKLGFVAVRVEKQHSLARRHDVLCNRCMLTRKAFRQRKAA